MGKDITRRLLGGLVALVALFWLCAQVEIELAQFINGAGVARGPIYVDQVCLDDTNQDTCITRTAAGALALNGAATFTEGFKVGLASPLGADTAHDVVIAVGSAQSADGTHDIVLAAATTKQLDVVWAAGTPAGGFGMPDLVGTLTLTFDKTANPDTITASGGTPWAACNGSTNETGTVIITLSVSNNNAYEVVSCTDTVLTLGNDVLGLDETGNSSEQARYIDTDTWYHLFLIEKAGTEDACFDTSIVAANCLTLSTYDQFRLLRSLLTGATANFVAF